VRNVAGEIVREIPLVKGQRKLNDPITLSYEDYPFMHYITGKMADGTSLYINGHKKLKVVPTTVKKQIPIFISTKGIYLITSLRFLYRNPEN